MGITFVDVLFALVIGRSLQVAVEWRELEASGIVHLGVAFTLTVTSWVGYHNSWNRPRYFIKFANLPLAQFGIDVLLVIVYWFTVAYVDGASGSLSPEPSAVPETILVTFSFLLYALWDQVAYRIRTSPKYPRFLERYDAPERRKVTGLFLMGSFFTFVYVVLLQPTRTVASILIVDAWLIFLLLGYRVVKELAIAPRELEPKPVENMREAIRLLTKATSVVSGELEDDADGE